MKNLFAILAFVCGTAVGLAAPTYYSGVVSNDHPVLYWNFDEAAGNAKEIIPVNLPTNINDLVPVANATTAAAVVARTIVLARREAMGCPFTNGGGDGPDSNQLVFITPEYCFELIYEFDAF